VANVHTGGAMWFNPAGVARLDARSVDLTGAVLSYNIITAPGVLSIESGEQSEGDFSALQAIPRALTFVASPRPALRWGIGFFFSRSLSRFLQDSVATQSDSLEPSEFYATADETKSLYHLSSALAWKKSDKFLLGGGFDIVVATQRLTEIISGAYGVSDAGVRGAGGTFNRSLNQAISGGGMQMKLGLQWAPIPEVRIGWMAATPSYLVYLNNETTATEQLSPDRRSQRYLVGCRTRAHATRGGLPWEVGLDRGRPDRGVPAEDLGARHQLERHGRRALGGNRPYHRETQAGRRLFDRLQPGEHAIRLR
jgi:hypothetical protein